ncbi:MAG TPA: hypothetical protein VHR45_19805 [Thermoanaerobaculia bacterium]|nr:hypothetical protein [Thermoanaerobaculia bacterium]
MNRRAALERDRRIPARVGIDDHRGEEAMSHESGCVGSPESETNPSPPSRVPGRRCLLIASLAALAVTAACTGLAPRPVASPPARSLASLPPLPSTAPSPPPPAPDRIVIDEGDARLEREEWFMRRRIGPDGFVPPDLFGREVTAWQAWAATHPRRIAGTESAAGGGTQSTSPFHGKLWQEIGPRNIAGRVLSVAFDPTNPDTIWAGSAGGGLWKTTDFGQTWKQMGGDYLPSLWISALAVDPNHPRTVYMGTGEANSNYGGYGGFGGMLKTADGGKTLTQITLPGNRFGSTPYGFLRTVISTANSQLVLSASNAGIYRSDDAGGHFALVLEHGITDLVQDPNNPSRFVAVDSAAFGDAASGLFESLDSGLTWNPLGSGLPNPHDWGRSALAFAPAPSPVAYLAIAEKIGGSLPAGLYKSSDGGHSWALLVADQPTQKNGYHGVGWYGAHLYVASWDPNTLFQANGGDLRISTDGGFTWRQPGGNWHVDTHGFAVHPLDHTRMVLATDGGVAVSADGGANFDRVDRNFPTVQYYSCAIGLTDSFTLFGGTQDNWMNVYRGAAGGAFEYSYPPGFGDVGGITVNPAKPEELLVPTAGMAGIGLSEDNGKSFVNIRYGHGIPDDEGGPWATRMARSALDAQKVYVGGHRLDTSSDGGHSWRPIQVRSDLNQTIEDIAVSRVSDQEIWTMWGDASVFLSEDGGATWKDVTPPSRYRGGNRISAGPAPHTAYALLGGFNGARLFRTHDGGAGWTDISPGLPDLALNAVVADPHQPGRLIVATDAGVALSDDDGQSWQDESGALPRAVVWDLCFDPGSGRLAAATYGRGLWELKPPPPCAPSATSLCLDNNRFEVTATWATPTASGTAQVVPLSGDTGYLYFFDPKNVEAVVKLVDGCSLNKDFWVFAGGLTNVATAITVRDSLTGTMKTYSNPQGTAFQPIQDTSAFATCAAPNPAGPDAANEAAAAAAGPPADGASSRSPWLQPPSSPIAASAGSSLLLNGNRFKVDVTWQTPAGGSGAGTAVSLTDDTGFFWFFDSSKVEMVIKVLNACGINGSYWAFAGGLTNVQTTITVTDTKTGAAKTYVNPQNTPFKPIQDTGAFPACP